MYQFQLAAISAYFSALPQAIGTTLEITVVSIGLSTPLAVVLAKGRMSQRWPLALVARAYVELFRNVPLLVLLYVFFFGLAQAGLHLSNYWATIAALSVNSAAYCAEIFRSGYSAIPNGQREAARALGLRALPTEWCVLLPQVIRVITPAYANQCIGVLIGSSIAAVIGVSDLSNWMLVTGSESFRYMESFLVAAVIYIILCQVVAVATAAYDQRHRALRRG